MAKSEPKTGLNYVGKGLVIPGVPPRGLEHSEVLDYGGYDLLIGSGLYKTKSASRKSKEK